MPMSATPLVVETGDIVAGANTFVSADTANQYLFDRGLVTQEQVDTVNMAALLLRGLNAFVRLDCLSGYVLPLSAKVTIPAALVEAQIWAAYYILLDDKNDPGTMSEQAVKRERVGDLEIEYQDGQSTRYTSVDSMTNVRAALSQITGCNGGSRSIDRA